MLDSGDLLPETVEELQEYLGEIDRAGSLDPTDTDYVHGLAQRLGITGKRGGPGNGASAHSPAAANDSGADPRTAIARARELVLLLFDPDTGLNPEVSDDRAAEILGEVLQSLDDAGDALSRK